MENVPAMPGADALATWFGYWPSFHDAEIHALHLNRQGISLLKIQTWHMTNRVDDRGFYVTEKYVLVTFSMEQITSLVLDDFNHQNVLSELVIEQVPNGCVLTLKPCYGLSSIIEAKEMSVAFVPVETYQGPSV